MSGERVYSPNDICKMFNISKSTLFRWEQEEWFPRVSRDLRGQRQYTQAHIQAISEKQKEQLSKQFGRAADVENNATLEGIAQAISLHKFLEGDMTGLYELAEYPRLPPDIILQLAQRALERYTPADKAFCEIMQVVWKQSCKLSQTDAAREEG